jgi:uridine kinase
VVNNELRELTYPIVIDSRVRPVTMADADGARIYRRSLTFLLESAFEDLFPEADLAVDHSVSSGGYYCKPIGRGPLSAEEIAKLSARMKELVEQDLPFERQNVPLQEAVNYFKQKGQEEKVRLLKYRQKEYLVMYKLRERRDYHHGYMVPSTGYLRWFAFTLMGEGFVLRFTRRNTPTELMPMPDYPKLVKTFRQYGDWLNRLGIESVGMLNDAIAAGRTREVILVSEALHEQKIADIARQIVEHREMARIVLIAGPSSSGKTTFSKRLTVQLLSQGISPYPLELDNFFVDREETPRDRNGQFDYESLNALDTAKLAVNLHDLVAGRETQLPHYNFKSGKSEVGDVVHLEAGQMVILEGIHGLNPKLIPDFPKDQAFRIYVSCLTQLNLDRHNRISTTDTRLLRRIVRDARERGYSALQTIQRWESVRRGEKTHIFPYQENADEMFNSALVYELSALKPVAEPLLRQVPFGTAEFIEAKRLLAFLDWFQPLDIDMIPDNSILREFVGGSILKEFKLWATQ